VNAEKAGVLPKQLANQTKENIKIILDLED
jgi:hypothetical protein